MAETNQIQVVITAVDQMSDELRKINSELGKLDKSSSSTARQSAATGKALDGLNGKFSVLSTTVRALQASFIAITFKKLVQSIIEVQISLDKMTRFFEIATGGAAAGAKEFAFVRAEAERLGLPLQELAETYGQFGVAAVQAGLSLETVRKIFTSTAQALTVMNADGMTTRLVFLALEQMISKGTVSMEELRRQLGQRIPGAFQLAAKAMGVSTSQLDKMVSSGQVMATDLLPKLAKEFDRVFGPQVAAAASDVQSSMARVKNALFELNSELGKAGVLENYTSLMGELSRVLSDPDMQAGLATLINGISTLFGLVAKFAPALAALAGGGALAALFTGALGPIAAITIATGAAAVAIIGLGDAQDLVASKAASLTILEGSLSQSIKDLAEASGKSEEEMAALADLSKTDLEKALQDLQLDTSDAGVRFIVLADQIKKSRFELETFKLSVERFGYVKTLEDTSKQLEDQFAKAKSAFDQLGLTFTDTAKLSVDELKEKIISLGQLPPSTAASLTVFLALKEQAQKAGIAIQSVDAAMKKLLAVEPGKELDNSNLVDAKAQKALESFTKSLQSQVDALKIQRKELEEGGDAALMYGINLKAVAEGIKPEAIKKYADEILRLTQSLREDMAVKNFTKSLLDQADKLELEEEKLLLGEDAVQRLTLAQQIYRYELESGIPLDKEKVDKLKELNEWYITARRNLDRLTQAEKERQEAGARFDQDAAEEGQIYTNESRLEVERQAIADQKLTTDELVIAQQSVVTVLQDQLDALKSQEQPYTIILAKVAELDAAQRKLKQLQIDLLELEKQRLEHEPGTDGQRTLIEARIGAAKNELEKLRTGFDKTMEEMRRQSREAAEGVAKDFVDKFLEVFEGERGSFKKLLQSMGKAIFSDLLQTGLAKLLEPQLDKIAEETGKRPTTLTGVLSGSLKSILGLGEKAKPASAEDKAQAAQVEAAQKITESSVAQLAAVDRLLPASDKLDMAGTSLLQAAQHLQALKIPDLQAVVPAGDGKLASVKPSLAAGTGIEGGGGGEFDYALLDSAEDDYEEFRQATDTTGSSINDLDAATNQLEGGFRSFTQMLTQSVRGIAGITGGVGGGANGIIGAVQGALSTVGTAINIFSSISKLFSFGKGGVVSNAGKQLPHWTTNLPHFGSGTIAQGPVVGVIGEEGPEIVARMKPAKPDRSATEDARYIQAGEADPTDGADLISGGVLLNAAGLTLDEASAAVGSAGINLDSAGLTLGLAGVTLDAAGLGLNSAADNMLRAARALQELPGLVNRRPESNGMLTLPKGVLRPFASGGIVTQPTVGLIGEEGNEIVARMKPAGQRRDNQPNVQVQINGDITPRRPDMKPEDIIKIIVDNGERKGAVGEMVNNWIRRSR